MTDEELKACLEQLEAEAAPIIERLNRDLSAEKFIDSFEPDIQQAEAAADAIIEANQYLFDLDAYDLDAYDIDKFSI